MHGDGHSGLHHNDGLLNVNGIFENRFDVILTNPPFGSRVGKEVKITESDKYKDQEKIAYYQKKYGEAYSEALRQVNDNFGKPILDLFDVGKFSGLTEVLFMERCIRLLKKGGRMGIVLPEGVLNNSNLQKIRDYFEGRAKIILIVSIPQDVFVSAKATVKPSLVFLKKFDEGEEKGYDTAKLKSEKQARENHKQELEKIENSDLSKKEKSKKLKETEDKIEEETKQLIKEKFNYQIPIVEVKQAGISTTGEACKNELVDVVKEFKAFRKKTNLWHNPAKVEVAYNLANDEIKKVAKK
jgi:type I restriction enzyme M protein